MSFNCLCSWVKDTHRVFTRCSEFIVNFVNFCNKMSSTGSHVEREGAESVVSSSSSQDNISANIRAPIDPPPSKYH